jgi:hypothetical protein
MAGSWNVWVHRRRRLIYIGASTGARGTFWCKRSPEKEKSKLASRRREIPKIIRGEENYPEATGLCFLGRGTPIFCLFVV